MYLPVYGINFLVLPAHETSRQTYHVLASLKHMIIVMVLKIEYFLMLCSFKLNLY